ncbi:MAG: hypothetical protein FI719_00050 [SAR202 cluster bacterium]|nr:hypothetical protein [SAR202 cluster bacterium]
MKRDFKFIEDIPNDFVEIIHSLLRIDVHATNFLTLTPYDGLEGGTPCNNVAIISGARSTSHREMFHTPLHIPI